MTRTITDSRGVQVTVPKNITRVVTVSDAMIEGTMTALGVDDKIVGIGSSCIPQDFSYSYPLDNGGFVNGTGGRDIVKVLSPKVAGMPAVIQSGTAMNYETLAGLKPDVVILRIGDCALQKKDDEKTPQTIERIESLGIPVIVLYSPNCYDKPNPKQISGEIRILGRLFEREEKADRIAQYLESQLVFVENRTKDIPDSEKQSVISLGLSPQIRAQGGAGNVHGLKTTESSIIEDIVNAKNAYRTEGRLLVNTEQLLVMNPDAIVLCTSMGYHPPGELFNATYYKPLRDLNAVKNKRVSALPWSPCNCAMRLEYPIDVMVIAKTTYPDRFSDVKLDEWLLEFYKNVYGVNDEKAKELRTAQWMDWTVGA
ncbi:MAG: ABC transporter substrate-binding protein [Methanoregula sp.]